MVVSGRALAQSGVSVGPIGRGFAVGRDEGRARGGDESGVAETAGRALASGAGALGACDGGGSGAEESAGSGKCISRARSSVSDRRVARSATLTHAATKAPPANAATMVLRHAPRAVLRRASRASTANGSSAADSAATLG